MFWRILPDSGLAGIYIPPRAPPPEHPDVLSFLQGTVA